MRDHSYLHAPPSIWRDVYSCNIHVASVHEWKKPYLTEMFVIIALNARTTRVLDLWITSIHEWKMSFKCNDCDTSFANNWVLNQHKVSVHERKKNILNSIFVMPGLPKGANWIIMWYQFIKRNNLLNATIVISAFHKRSTLKIMWHRFMKEIKNCNILWYYLLRILNVHNATGEKNLMKLQVKT